jgi:cobalt-zinc-cadmium efflux system outer membrane protein
VLDQAAEAAQQAYRSGAIGYRDWASTLDDITAARFRRLQAVVTARRALIELQRLTGSALEALPANREPANGQDEDLP